MKKIVLSFFFFIYINLSSAQDIDSATISRLEFFAKAYNLVKFFYPADELVNFPWDNWGAHKVESILHIKNDQEYIDSMQCFFEEIAPGVALLPKNVSYPMSLITPPNPLEYQDTTFFQYVMGLGTLDSKHETTLNYRYKRSKKDRFFYEAKFMKRYAGKNMRIYVSGSISGKMNSKDTNVLIKLVNKKTKPLEINIPIIFRTNNEEVFSTQLKLDDSILNYKLFVKYPSDDYQLRIKKFKIDIEIDGNWFDLDSLEKFSFTKKSFVLNKYDFDYSDTQYFFKINNIFNERLYYPLKDVVDIKYNNVTFHVPLILKCNKFHTYPYTNFSFNNKNMSNINSSFSSDILGLMNLYGYLYLDYAYIDSNFKNKMAHAFERSINNRNDLLSRDISIWLENEFLNQLGDPHLDIKVTESNKKKSIKVFFNVISMNNKLFVVQSKDTNLLKNGDEILEIESVNIQKYFYKLKDNVSIIQKDRFFYNLIWEMFNSRKDSFLFKVIRKSKELNVYINPKNIKNAIREDKNYLTKINDSILFISNDFEIKTREDYDNRNNDIIFIDSFLERSKNENKYLIIKNFSKEFKINFKKYISDITNTPCLLNKQSNIPFNKYSWDTLKIGNLDTPILNKLKFIFLIDRNTQSSEEFILYPYINNKNVYLIGENTAGANGAVNRISINNLYDFDYTSNKMGYYDTQGNFHNHQYYGIKPNIYLERDVASFRDHTDYFLDQTIEMIQQGTLDKMKKKIDKM